MTLVEAIERAATALEYRIKLGETRFQQEEDHRAGTERGDGVSALLREGLENDRAALAVIKAYLGEVAP